MLGTVARNEDEAKAKWAACDLAKVLVGPEELSPDVPAKRVFTLPAATLTAPARETDGDVRVPPLLGFGIREREERMLFGHLPLLSADMNTRHEMSMMDTNSSSYSADVEAMSKYHEKQLVAGVAQANVLAKLVDLRNANAAGIAFENRRRVIEAFSEPEKPNDTGRTEVQGAVPSLLSRFSINSSDFFFGYVFYFY